MFTNNTKQKLVINLIISKLQKISWLTLTELENETNLDYSELETIVNYMIKNNMLESFGTYDKQYNLK